ncbi:MAG: AraC family transcriptional regulator [Pseudomonadota bacterium]
MFSRNYKPSAKLAPYVRDYYIFQAPLPEDHVIEDFLLAETAFVRCLIKGDWRGGDAPEEFARGGLALFSGANSKPYKVRLTGSLDNVGIAFRPGGWRALFVQSHTEFADDVFNLADVWGHLGDTLFHEAARASDDAEKIAVVEDVLIRRLDHVGVHEFDEAMAKFERFSRQDSTIRIDDAADQIGLSVRQMERRCKYHFGFTPKAVLRRSRFLDMAAAMRGFSSPSEQALAELRYFDDSHLNKEFKQFADMTPGQFKEAITPLQTAGLKFREESRYDD